jgi:hypothetical protein
MNPTVAARPPLVRRVTRDAFGFAEGTQFQGRIDVSYAALVAAFGDPGPSFDDGKTTAEWVLATPSGAATVYDYHGSRWHVGGHHPEVLDYILEALGDIAQYGVGTS